MDSDLDQSLGDSVSLDFIDTPRSINQSNGRQSALDPSHPDYLELESVTSGKTIWDVVEEQAIVCQVYYQSFES